MENLNLVLPEIFISLSIMFLLILGVFKKDSSKITFNLSLFTILISAIIPTTADKIFSLLNINKQNYSNLCEDSLNNVNEFKPLLKRLEKDNFEGILDNNE